MIILALLLLTLLGFAFYGGRRYGQKRRLASHKAVAKGHPTMTSQPIYYGFSLALWVLVPSLTLWIIAHFWFHNILPTDLASTLPPVLQTLSWAGIILGFGLVGLLLGYLFIRRHRFKAQYWVEGWVKIVFLIASFLAILTTIGIIASLLFEAIRFFQLVPIDEFLFGLEWSPQTAIRTDQVTSEGKFGVIPLLTGTLLITFIALAVAVPIGLYAAIYLANYASPKVRSIFKPALEVLAGIPTVVYGFFAALTVAPFIRTIGDQIGLDVSSESALAAGLVMGIMIIPFISSLSDDVISAVPSALHDGSYGLGATKSETIRKVVLPAAMPGIIASVLLAFSRAIGETMIVVMAAGLRANLTLNPLEDVTTITVQIVNLLKGDQEFDSAKTLSVFALGLLLFVITLIMNIIALRVVKKYRGRYG